MDEINTLYSRDLILRSLGLQGQGVSKDGKNKGVRLWPSFETHVR
jgi:hypothetical protein